MTINDKDTIVSTRSVIKFKFRTQWLIIIFARFSTNRRHAIFLPSIRVIMFNSNNLCSYNGRWNGWDHPNVTERISKKKICILTIPVLMNWHIGCHVIAVYSNIGLTNDTNNDLITYGPRNSLLQRMTEPSLAIAFDTIESICKLYISLESIITLRSLTFCWWANALSLMEYKKSMDDLFY